MGPTFTKGKFESGEMCAGVMMNKMKTGSFLPAEFPLCDVRDVAKAHLEACVRDEAKNMRFIVAQLRPLNSIGEALVPKYGESYPVVTKTLGPGFVNFLGLFVKVLKPVKAKMGVKQTFDTRLTNDVLGIEFTDFNKTMEDMAVTMIDLGHVPDRRGKVFSKGWC